ncbi:hypothetical protein ACWEGE_34835 [Amycolatopsis sp. NPDC004747]
MIRTFVIGTASAVAVLVAVVATGTPAGEAPQQNQVSQNDVVGAGPQGWDWN